MPEILFYSPAQLLLPVLVAGLGRTLMKGKLPQALRLGEPPHRARDDQRAGWLDRTANPAIGPRFAGRLCLSAFRPRQLVGAIWPS
jgi:hypothetical protein